MALATIDSFFDLIRKSDLVDADRFSAYLDRLRAGEGVAQEPARLAAQMVRDAMLTQFQADQLLAGKWKGFHVGKYKVLELLGTGGMGKVYLAEHKFMRRRVALKVLPRSRVASDSSLLERFYREAKALGALDHPNIVRAYDHDNENDLHFLVMEFVDGVSFQDMVRIGGPVDPRVTAHWIWQAAGGLQHAHEVGLVHRDIKPGNLLVDRTGTVKILDMGLARFFKDEEDILTKKYDENVLGTADYLAPEQAVDSHGVDIRADIYSLGGTWYFLLTGASPFGEGTVAQKLIWHQTKDPRPVEELRKDVPRELLAILRKMMAKDPKDRYQVPGEVAQALEPWAQGPPPIPPEEHFPKLSPLSRGPGGSANTEVGSQPPTVKPGSSPGGPARAAKPAAPRPAAPVAPAPPLLAQAASPPPLLATPNPPRPAATAPRPTMPAPRPPSVAGPLPVPEPPPAATNGSPPAYPPAPTPSGGSHFAWAPVTSAPPPVTEVPPLPMPPPSNPFGWNLPGGDTPTAETPAPLEAGMRSRRPVKSRGKQGSGKLWLWVGVGVGVVAVAAIVVVVVLWLNSKKDKKAAAPTTAAATGPVLPADTVFVAKGGEAYELESLAEALEKAQKDKKITKIQVKPGVYEGQLTLDRFKARAGLVIEAVPDEDGKRAILAAPRKLGDGAAVVTLNGTPGITLKGFIIDGAPPPKEKEPATRRADDGLVILGSCAGLKIEDVTVKNCKRYGVRLEDCNAAELKGKTTDPKAGPTLLKGVTVEVAGDAGAAALCFRKDDASVTVEQCLFKGKCEALVRLEARELKRVTFERNVFFQGDGFGMLYPKGGPETAALGDEKGPIRLVNNTFCQLKGGFGLQQPPSPIECKFELTNNLFAQVEQAVVAENIPTPDSLFNVVLGAGNVLLEDGKSQVGTLAAKDLKITPVKGTLELKDKGKLFTYPKSSPLAKAGEKNGPVGAKEPTE